MEAVNQPYIPKPLVDELLRLVRSMPENMSEHVYGDKDDDIQEDALDRALLEYEMIRHALLTTLEELGKWAR